MSDPREILASFLLGRQSRLDCIQALFGDADPQEMEGLSVYAAHALRNQKDAVAAPYPRALAALTAHLGPEGLDALVARYSRAYPCRLLNPARPAETFPIFLAEYGGLPAWMVDLARFEKRLWDVENAPDDPADEIASDTPMLRSTFRLDSYGASLLDWVVDDPVHPSAEGEPPSRQTWVVSFRGSDLETRLIEVGPGDAALITRLLAGETLGPEAAELLLDLRAAGAFRGT